MDITFISINKCILFFLLLFEWVSQIIYYYLHINTSIPLIIMILKDSRPVHISLHDDK